MLMPILLLLAASAGADCTAPMPRHTGPWRRGQFLASPVVAEQQSQAIERLGGRSLERIDLALARAASGDSGLAPARFYYLARAAYVGGTGRPGTAPPTMRVSVDVDTRGTAYVTTFLLTRRRGSSPLAVVLASGVPLKAVVPVCIAAE